MSRLNPDRLEAFGVEIGRQIDARDGLAWDMVERVLAEKELTLA